MINAYCGIVVVNIIIHIGLLEAKIKSGEGQLVLESRRTSTQKSARTFILYIPPDCEKMC